MVIPFPDTDIYCLTDSRQSLGRSTIEVVRQMLAADIKLIQYREKHKSKKAMLEECLVLRQMTREAGCCFLVNDHVDIALACDADGVHAGQDDMPLAMVRELVGPERIVGISTHSWAEAEAAIAGGADYIGVGPIFPTATKAEAKAVGFAYLQKAAANCSIPFTAIGGINEASITECVRHGAKLCAIVSAITMAPDIPARIARLRELHKEGRA